MILGLVFASLLVGLTVGYLLGQPPPGPVELSSSWVAKAVRYNEVEQKERDR